MSNIFRPLLTLVLSVGSMMAWAAADGSVVPTQKGAHLTFVEGTQYSRLVIDSRLTDFYANTKPRGLNRYDSDGHQTATSAGEIRFDYVIGLVAKGIIEATEYYGDQEWTRPWYYSVENYANTFCNSVETKGGNLDNLNAAKMYFTVHDLATGVFSDRAAKNTKGNCRTAMDRTLQGLRAHDSIFSIKSSVSRKDAGGWYHKDIYPNQMWLDGQYMGPALLARLNNYGRSINANAADWDLITRQYSICWDRLWDKKKHLLFHAFSADPKSKESRTWADTKKLHSKEYWGRAEGWYFLGLVDVLDEMQKAGQTGTANYNTLRSYLNQIADGLAEWQDAKTGCWYQLLAHDGTFYADKYDNGKPHVRTYNYLESSATAIFLASYMKGMRLGLLDKDYTQLVKKGYKGFIENFMVSNGDGTVQIIGCCMSAGLGPDAPAGTAKYRDGSAAYYLLAYDTPPTSADPSSPAFYTEGKVMGAFILAATEYERMFSGTVTVFMIGDSTMANKTDSLERGWGMVLNEHLQGNIRVDNHAKNGRSSKSFIDEGRWDKVISKVKPGDYVLIQFGHNDEKPQTDRHTDPQTTFKANLRKFISETRAKGGIPVLYNSIIRRKFEADTLTDTHGEYIIAPRELAAEMSVPFVDAASITRKFIEPMGDEASKAYFMWYPPLKQDDTHLNRKGALAISRLLIEATAEVVPDMRKYIK